MHLLHARQNPEGHTPSNDRPKRGSMFLQEVTISNMWEMAAIVELLERKGLCTKQDLYNIVAEFRSK